MGVTFEYCYCCEETLCTCGVRFVHCLCGALICEDCFNGHAMEGDDYEEAIPGCKSCLAEKQKALLKKALGLLGMTEEELEAYQAPQNKKRRIE